MVLQYLKERVSSSLLHLLEPTGKRLAHRRKELKQIKKIEIILEPTILYTYHFRLKWHF